MAKPQKDAPVAQPGFWASMLQGRLYKPNQGRVVRQVTAVSIGLIVLLGSFEFSTTPLIVRWGKSLNFEGMSYAVLLALSCIGLWIAYRIVNVPKFADFLIAVEAEMKKVSWPGRGELWRASVVVIFVIFAMAGLLFMFDVIWNWFFILIRIRYGQ